MTNNDLYTNYCRQFTKLSVWYARQRILAGLSDFEDAFNKRVNIFRNTSIYSGAAHPASGDVFPQWNDLLGRVQQIFDEYSADEDTSRLEEKCLEAFWPSLKERIDTIGDPLPDLSERPYESWLCNYGEDKCLHIHIDNTYRPASPLSERKNDFAACLIRLLRDSQAQRPEITVVSCGSWLNSLPAFQELFTEAWRDSAEVITNVRHNLGFWGQFKNRRGDFHTHNGQKFRELGTFPYPPLHCRDQIQAVLDHLTAHFPEAIAINQRRGYA